MFLRIQHGSRATIAWLLAGLAILITACSSSSRLPVTPPVTSTPAQAGNLTPYSTPTARQVSTGEAPVSPPTGTPQPSPTATPRIHVVKKGEDMGGIAFLYRVSLEALMAANPTVQPNVMSVGTRLVIPPSKTQMPPQESTPAVDANPPTPTPVAVTSGKMNCARVDDGGMWCFLPVTNSQTYPLEGITAIFRLADQQSQASTLPLDRLEPGTALPLAAYFPPEQVASITPPYQVAGEITSALPNADDGRYLPVHLDNKKVMLAENGLSAALTADVILDGSRKANRVWVAAAAYDAQGNVVGVRRWEKAASQPLESGQALPFTINIYSVSTAINRVDLFAEARP